MLLALLLAISAAQIPQAPVRVGGDIKPPTRLKYVNPVYPQSALGASVAGMVIIEATIDPVGHVSDAKVIRSIPLLDQAAIDAVKQWEFTPTLVNGVPASVIMTVTVNFSIQGVPPAAGAVPESPAALRLTSIRSNDATYVWEITPERAATLPQWSPALGPPLSVQDAARIAGDWLAGKAAPAPPRLVLQAVTLMRGPSRSGTPETWFYLVNYINGSSPPLPGDQMARAVILLDGTVVEPRTEQSGAAQLPAPPSAPVYKTEAGRVTYPKIVREVRPQYTDAAREKKIQGTVLVSCVVRADGSVGDVQVVRSLDPTFGLDQAAIAAAKLYRFEPGTKDGQPVPVTVTIEMTFMLK